MSREAFKSRMVGVTVVMKSTEVSILLLRW